MPSGPARRRTSARGKAELVADLPAAPEGMAILNFDDPWCARWKRRPRRASSSTVFRPKPHLWADEVEGLGLDGIRFRLHYKNETLHVHLPMIGRHSVQTALRAAAVGLVEGMTWQEIFDGLRPGPHPAASGGSAHRHPAR